MPATPSITESVRYSVSTRNEDTGHLESWRRRTKPPLRRSDTNAVRFGFQWDSCTVDDTTHRERFQLDDLKIDEEEICSSLDCHRKFKVKEGYEMKNLPKFNDLTMYGVDEIQERLLWELEVRRLVKAAKSEQPILLEGPDEWYGSADREGYNRLHVLATAFRHALEVCIHDNELAMAQHQPAVGNHQLFMAAYRNLVRAFDSEEGIIRFDKQIQLAAFNDEAYHGLVNYVTATITRVLVRTLSGKFWVDNCLSTMAKFASKLKVVADDLPRAVSRTMDAHHEIRAHMEKAKLTGGQSDPLLGIEASPGTTGNERDIRIDMSTLEASGTRYFMVVDAFNTGITFMLSCCTSELWWDEEVDQGADIYETSAIIYGTGFRGSRTQLCQERGGAIGVGAERNLIHCAGLAFDVCREMWSKLPSVEGPLPDSAEAETTLVWNWTQLSEKGDLMASYPGSKRFSSMKQVINAFVPYLMFCGSTPDLLSGFARRIIHISDATNPAKFFAQPPCLAAARIRTSQYVKNQRRELVGLKEVKFQNVYDTPMARDGALAGIRVGSGPGDPTTTPEQETEIRMRHTRNREKYQTPAESAEPWIIGEKSITITSLRYSYVALAVVGILILGGLALVSMQDEIRGVDPSNLTVLIWTSAGFLTVFLKSRRVENWPWRDFLRGRVVCRSVSEVRAVTKINTQALLAILMRFESRSRLGKSGPFCRIFEQRAADAGNGFSIDVAPLTETAIAGGHIFVGVDSTSGTALVGLEARSRANYAFVDRKDSLEEGGEYVCSDFVEPDRYPISEAGEGGWLSGIKGLFSWLIGVMVQRRKEPEIIDGKEGGRKRSGSPDGRLPRYPIRREGITWHRVKGVFVEKAEFG